MSGGKKKCAGLIGANYGGLIMNQEIKCDVEECKYQGGFNNCTLSNIQVSNTDMNVHEKSDTGCMSFECEH